MNLTLGKNIAKGIPGKPPPVPTSKILVVSLNFIIFTIERECRIWFINKFSISLLDIKLTFEFQSLYIGINLLNCFNWSCDKFGKYFFNSIKIKGL